MATSLQYGDVTINSLHTKSFRQETTYDESGADPLHTTTTIRVFGVATINEQGANKGFISGVPGTSIAEHGARICKMLWEPRKSITFSVNDIPVLICTGVATGTGSPVQDVNNGPKPRHVEIVNIIGSKSIWVEFEVEVCRILCDNLDQNGILSNRWSVTDDIDEQHYCQRTIEGVVRFAHVNVSVTNIRAVAIPPLPTSFVRQSMRFTVQPDGLACRYSIVDRQTYATPPAPLSRFQGTYTLSTADHGISQLVEIVVSGEGPAYVPKKDVITKLMQIAYSRVNIASLGTSASIFLESCAIMEKLEANAAEVRFRLRFNGESSLFNVQTSNLGAPLGGGALTNYTNGVATPIPTFGAGSSVGLWVCYLQTPCGGNHNIAGDGQGQGTGQQGTSPGTTPMSPPSVTVSVGTVESPVQLTASAEHKEAMYTYYRIGTQYPTNNHRAALPLANEPASGKTAAIIPLAKATQERLISISAERIGKPPSILEPVDYDEAGGVKAFLMSYEIIPRAPVPSPDGRKQIFAIDATYRYAFDKPIPPSASVNIGKLPWDGSTSGSAPATSLLPPGG